MEIQEEMESDLQHICRVLQEEAEIEVTAANIYRYQTDRQYHQYSMSEIRRWLRGKGQVPKRGRPAQDKATRAYTLDSDIAKYLDSLPDGERSRFVNSVLRDAMSHE